MRATRELGEEFRIISAVKKLKNLQPKIPPNTTKGAELQIVAAIIAEAHTQWNPHTACTTAVKPTTAPKIAPFSLKPIRKWSKNPLNLRNNHHPEK
jgi:hypothetical protein